MPAAALMAVSPSRVGNAHDRVGVGDVERVADERHAERRVAVLSRNGRLHLGDAVAVGVAQQRDAIRARHRAAGLLLVPLEEPALDALAVLGPRRRVGLGDEHVAVRQHVEPARMIEAARECGDGRAAGGGRRRAVGPADGFDDVDRGKERRLRLRQGRLGADARRLRGGRRRAAPAGDDAGEHARSESVDELRSHALRWGKRRAAGERASVGRTGARTGRRRPSFGIRLPVVDSRVSAARRRWASLRRTCR